MKKISFKLLALLMMMVQGVAFTACSDDDDNNDGGTATGGPQISMERTHYNLATGSIEIAIKADQAPAADLNIPVRCAGTAQASTDYTLSADHFVLKAGQSSAVITVTRNEATIGDDNLTLTINLENGTGYTLGLTNYSEVTLLGNNGYIMSFLTPSAKLTDEDTYSIQLYKMDGYNYKPAFNETFEIEVDTENSTAVEGVNFTFPEGKHAIVETNKYQGSFKVKVLKAEADHNVLVIRLADKAGYATGANPTMTIDVAGPDNFSGTWAFKGIVNTDQLATWGEFLELDKMPTATSSETITFNGTTESYTFTPNFTGDFKNYFGTEARTVKFDQFVGKNFQEIMSADGRNVKVSQLLFPGINVNFSASASNIREAKVCFRLITSDNQEVLECTLDDFEPVEGGYGSMIVNDWAMGADEIPMRIHFTRVK